MKAGSAAIIFFNAVISFIIGLVFLLPPDNNSQYGVHPTLGVYLLAVAFGMVAVIINEEESK